MDTLKAIPYRTGTFLFFFFLFLFLFLNIFIDYAITVVPFPPPLHSRTGTFQEQKLDP